MLHTSHTSIQYTSHHHHMQYHNKCYVYLTGVTLGGHASLPISLWASTFQASSTTTCLLDLLGSRCGVCLRIQASDGFEEQALKSPFEAAVRIEAGWLLNGFPNLSHYSGKVGVSYIFLKMSLWEVSDACWHIAAWTRFSRSLQHKMSSPAPGNSQFAMVRSVEREL